MSAYTKQIYKSETVGFEPTPDYSDKIFLLPSTAFGESLHINCGAPFVNLRVRYPGFTVAATGYLNFCIADILSLQEPLA